jgi:acyl-CoA synthetase (AMP-forming)/AMP-acid ligase II
MKIRLTGGNEILIYFNSFLASLKLSEAAEQASAISSAPAWNNISDAIISHGARYPDRATLIDGNDQIGPAALANLVGRAAVCLRSLGKGYISLKGRHADLIRRVGEDIHPQEAESVIAAYPLVRKAAVTARPADAGAAIVAYVVLSGALPQQDFAHYCIARLPASMRPAEIFYAAALPRTPNGKLDRPAIRALAARPATALAVRAER